MKVVVVALVACFSIFGQPPATSKPKLTAIQQATIEAANQQALVAQYLARIAELEKQVATLQVRVVIAEACSSADLKLSECEVSPDGNIGKKTK